MDIKIKIKNALSNYNPFAISHRNRMQRKLVNRDFSFICPNCLGGMLLHDLGLPFLSPTVNLMMNQCKFIKFVLDMDYYLSQKLCFYDDPYYVCPCAKVGEGHRAITIHFTLYASREEAESCWKKRIPRIRYDNLFVFAMEKDGITKEDILRLGTLKVRGVVVLTAHDYQGIPYTCFVPKYQKQGEVGNILVRSYLNDKKEYESYFDFVKWFNEANGGNYNCRPYCL